MGAIGSPEDQFTLRAPAFSKRYFKDETGLTRSSQFPPTTGKTLCVIVAGQSNSANTTPDPYTIANPTKMDQLSLDNGLIYRAAPRLLGAESGSSGLTVNTWVSAADKLLTAGDYDKVILAAVGISGTTILQWRDTLYRRIVVAYNRLSSLGFEVNAITFQQGENDNPATSGTDYASRLSSMIGAVRDEGCLTPWVIARATWNGTATNSGIRTAQWSLNNSTDIFPGPDADALLGANRNGGDGLHFSAIGRENLAAAWRTAILDAL